jgi:hypothetical protein
MESGRGRSNNNKKKNRKSNNRNKGRKCEPRNQGKCPPRRKTAAVPQRSEPLSGPLPCGSWETLTPGIFFTIQSKNYPSAYPKNHNCAHFFDVSRECQKPQIRCDNFDVRKTSKQKTCIGRVDKLSIRTNNRDLKRFCGSKPINYIHTRAGTIYFDAFFATNRRFQASGYSCQIYCGGVPPPSPPISEGNCGVPNTGVKANKIVGGAPTLPNEFPWQVALTTLNGSAPFCGGSLISDKTVLTSASCTFSRSVSDISVIVGEHDTSTDEDEQELIEVEQKIIHPEYNQNTFDNDFALLTLAEPVNWSREVKPICFPIGEPQQYEGIQATVSGWGTLTANSGQLQNVLHKVDVFTQTNQQCVGDSTVFTSSRITSNMICAADQGRDSCRGDGGG